MSTTGTVTVTGQVTGDLDTAAQTAWGPATLAQGTAVPNRQTVNLVNGDNTITLPAGTTVVEVVLPGGNGNPVSLKGVGGDGTHLNLGTQGLACVLQVNGFTTFVLNAAGAVNGVLVRSQ